MASKEEEQRLLEDVETSNETSTAPISSALEESHNVLLDSGSSRYTNRSASQGFVPVEVSQLHTPQYNIITLLQLATFPTLDFNTGFEMSRALERCKRRVLNPYHYFLKTVRSIFGIPTHCIIFSILDWLACISIHQS